MLYTMSGNNNNRNNNNNSMNNMAQHNLSPVAEGLTPGFLHSVRAGLSTSATQVTVPHHRHQHFDTSLGVMLSGNAGVGGYNPTQFPLPSSSSSLSHQQPPRSRANTEEEMEAEDVHMSTEARLLHRFPSLLGRAQETMQSLQGGPHGRNATAFNAPTGGMVGAGAGAGAGGGSGSGDGSSASSGYNNIMPTPGFSVTAFVTPHATPHNRSTRRRVSSKSKRGRRHHRRNTGGGRRGTTTTTHRAAHGLVNNATCVRTAPGYSPSSRSNNNTSTSSPATGTTVAIACEPAWLERLQPALQQDLRQQGFTRTLCTYNKVDCILQGVCNHECDESPTKKRRNADKSDPKQYGVPDELILVRCRQGFTNKECRTKCKCRYLPLCFRGYALVRRHFGLDSQVHKECFKPRDSSSRQRCTSMVDRLQFLGPHITYDYKPPHASPRPTPPSSSTRKRPRKSSTGASSAFVPSSANPVTQRADLHIHVPRRPPTKKPRRASAASRTLDSSPVASAPMPDTVPTTPEDESDKEDLGRWMWSNGDDDVQVGADGSDNVDEDGLDAARLDTSTVAVLASLHPPSSPATNAVPLAETHVPAASSSGSSAASGAGVGAPPAALPTFPPGAGAGVGAGAASSAASSSLSFSYMGSTDDGSGFSLLGVQRNLSGLSWLSDTSLVAPANPLMSMSSDIDDQDADLNFTKL